MDIRLLCGNTVVHSDMLLWNTKDTVESAALQFINILFSVPQLSMKFENLTEDHLKMSNFWLSCWKQHRYILIDGRLTPYHPELNYPGIASSTEEKYLTAVYADFIVHLGKEANKNIILVNGTLKDKLYIEIENDLGQRQIETVNCMGEVIKRENINLNKGVLIIDIPVSGVAYIK